MTNSFLPHSYSDMVIDQAATMLTLKNGCIIPQHYVNATQMVKAVTKQTKKRKEWNKYFKSENTQEFLHELAKQNNCVIDIGAKTPYGVMVLNQELQPLVIVNKGGNNLEETGTWVHLEVALHFAQWLCPKFAVWATKILRHHVEGNYLALTAEAEEAQKQLQIQWQQIRDAGKVSRRKLTDVIKDWYERNPNGTSRPQSVMYAVTTNEIYQRLWGMDAQCLEKWLGCGRNESRNFLDEQSLKTLDRAELNTMELIDEDNLKPIDAARHAQIRKTKSSPKAK